MAFDRLTSNIPIKLIEGARQEIEKVSNKLKSYGVIRKISKEKKDFTAIFTDGSNVVSERRGAGVVIFSAVSVKYRVERSGWRGAIEEYVIDPEKTFLILLPKFNLGSRANAIMRGLEHLSAYSLVDETVDFAVFDGSYVTSLIEPRARAREHYMEIIRILNEKGDREFNEFFFEIINTIDRGLSRWFNSLFNKGNDVRDIFKNFFENYYQVYEEIYDNIVKDFSGQQIDPLITNIQNLTFILLEQNFAVGCLLLLLRKLKENNIPAIWISKDSESRHLTKNLTTLALSNDLALLDFVLSDGEYVNISDIKDIRLSKIEPERFTIVDPKDIKLHGKIYSVIRDYSRSLYRNFSDYEITYAKIGGPVLQITFPKNLLSLDKLGDILGSLMYINVMGYPEPLIFVHNKATLRERVIKILSEGLYQLCSKRGNSFLCNLLQRSGRESIL